MSLLRDERIEPLLILQERDARCDLVERELAAIPGQIEGFRARITSAQEALQARRASLKALEVRRRELEQLIETAEEQIRRYQTQQLAVKKNEEYQALTAEIDGTKAEISQHEDEEIELLMQVDEDKETLAKAEENTTAEIAELKGHIKRLEVNEQEWREELTAAREAVASSRTQVAAPYLSAYDYLRKRGKKAPHVVPLKEQACGGCFLRISNDIAAAARKGETVQRCDQCGRIVYHER